MKVHIAFDFKDGPWGGGNQFLKALREQWRKKGVYAENFDDADAYLTNAFPTGNMELFRKPIDKKIKENKFIFYRLDGLYYRNRLDESQKKIDDVCMFFANNFVDGVIYQTNWIKEIQQNYGIDSNISNVTCLNAPDDNIFSKSDILDINGKIKLVSTCWAPNKRKGFDFYKYLDENLDFSKYEMTFLGNSPVDFKNIKMKKPLSSKELAEELKNYNTFVSCAFDEPCSNSLIESMHMGLPAVGHNSGGTPEIIKNSKQLFNDCGDIVSAIDYTASNYVDLKLNMKLKNIDKVSDDYYQFMLEVYKNGQSKKISLKSVNKFNKMLNKLNKDENGGKLVKMLLKKIINRSLTLTFKALPLRFLKFLVKKGFLVLLNRLNKTEKIKYLLEFDNFTYELQGYASVEYGDGIHSKHRHMKYHDFFIENIEKGEKILDIGCGYGALANSIATRSECEKIYGVEIDPKNVEKAKKIFNHKKVDFVLGDATKIEFEEQFDVIVLSNVLEHLKDRSDFLKKLNSNINPDRFLIRVPMYERDWRVPLKEELGLDYRLDPTHELEYTTEIFEQEIKNAGLSIESTIYKWGEVWAVVR